MKTQVCLTADIEFNIAGTFADPARFQPVAEPSVWCEVDGRSQGLGFLLETLAAHGLRATFFVEALNTSYFGDEPMGRIARRLRDAGHDVQLHLHPCWTFFRDPDWRQRLAAEPPSDTLVGRPIGEVGALIAEGIATFERWGLLRPVALRTGGLRVDLAVYEAMRRQGLDIASNVGLAIFRPAEKALQCYAGLHRINGVVEAPVLTYERPTAGAHAYEKTLTVTGSGWGEIESLLRRARDLGAGPVVVLTHPHEYVKAGDSERMFEARRPNRVNQARFERLAAFLARHRDEFETVTFAQAAEGWRAARESPASPRLRVPLARAAAGMVQNKLNDWIAWY
jgi:peptidoglycan/xylan/chitin deacetylase (PgdA/CDA1 family)